MEREVAQMGIEGAFVVPHPPLIIPEVGRGQERAIQKTIDAYDEIARKLAALEPETILVTSPHSVLYADYFHISDGLRASGSFARFQAGKVRISTEYDAEFVDTLSESAEPYCPSF